MDARRTDKMAKRSPMAQYRRDRFQARLAARRNRRKSAEREANWQINRLLEAVRYARAAAGSAEECGAVDSMNRLAEEAWTMLTKAKVIATGQNPAFWEAWRGTFEDLEQG